MKTFHHANNMITTWLTPNEIKAYSSVQDEQLNEIFQEVRSKFHDLYLLEETTIKVRRAWWRKPEKRTVYTLHVLINRFNECQTINFVQDHDCSINVNVSASYIITYFLGLLNGSREKKPL